VTACATPSTRGRARPHSTFSLYHQYKKHHWLLPQAGGPTRYDANVEAHQHVVCSQCGRVADVDVSDLISMRQLVARSAGFAEVVEERLEFYGCCSACAGKAE
jgi:Fur family peroxide stress response transcriptional regulator